MSDDNIAKDAERMLEGQRVTLSGQPADPSLIHSGAPGAIDPKTGMHSDYWVLSEAERAKGFVRPVRRSYIHNKCGTKTTMGIALCETYARDPTFYGSTFCCGCHAHYPVAEFKWAEDGAVVGT